MRNALILGVLVLLVLAAAGCRTYSGGVAPSNVPLAPDSYTKGARVSGTSWGIYIFWFIPVGFPSTEVALDDALRQSNGRPLVGVTTDTRHYFWPMIVYLERIKVDGTTALPMSKPK